MDKIWHASWYQALLGVLGTNDGFILSPIPCALCSPIPLHGVHLSNPPHAHIYLLPLHEA